MHSTYSDGAFTPEALLHVAYDRDLSVVAITDHDNARGARVAIPVAQRLGLELIPAIEFTGRWDDCSRPGWGNDVDILGYFIDLENSTFKQMEQGALDNIRDRIEECCARLTAAGYPVTLDEVLALNPYYPGARQLRKVLENKGYAADEAELIKLFAAQWPHVSLSRYTIADQIATIHAAGGVAVLAHPHGITCGEGLISEDRLVAVCEMGLDGIEIYHRNMNEAARAHFLPMAERFGLLISGGSDEHGFTPDLGYMGKQPVTREMVEALRARHKVRLTMSEG